MEYLITLLIISAGLFLASSLVKSEYWFVRLFFIAQVGWLSAFVLSLLIGAFFFSLLLFFILFLTGYRMYQANKSENNPEKDRGITIVKQCYKSKNECKYDCPGHCRESC